MWQVEFTKRADKEFSKLTPETRERIGEAIEEKLLVNPEKHLIALIGDMSGFYKFRVGDYRLLCKRDGLRLLITVVEIGHRSKIYH
jgi:mRNA interferase RelE/StbE